MSEHRYPKGGLIADYARTGAGLAMTLGPLAVVPPDGVAAPILGALALVFAAFGARTGLRQTSRVTIDADGIALVGPFRKRIDWDAVSDVRLRFFSTRRGSAEGWMQLTLRGPGATLRIDSTIDGFPAIARRAGEAARNNRLGLAPATLDNLRNFGITLGEPGWGARDGYS